MPRIAESVVIDPDDKRFVVDGEKFPWFVTEDGPSAQQIAEDLFVIRCTIFAHEGFSCAGIGQQPLLAGIEFPWYITEDGMEYRASRTKAPTVALAFFARSVDGPTEDVRNTHAYGGDKLHQGVA